MSFDALLQRIKVLGIEGHAERAAVKIREAIDNEFKAQSDPYGTPWRPLADSTAYRKGNDIILIDSGDMRKDITVGASGNTITISLPDPGVHHQFGTKYMPARPILPRDGLPDTWQAAIEASRHG